MKEINFPNSEQRIDIHANLSGLSKVFDSCNYEVSYFKKYSLKDLYFE